ncbi:hypothetical protein [Phaffia rhodozyma]|uniref:Uncharacterized protein n=1 Tax=Phaffia rhodozyma TaxID=264483 RepID=A0A0F7SF53_PHARH|nr:hypothetical protein [Phaffia rhodozyma]
MASYAPGQHPARGSNITKTHTRKPYARPELSVPSGIDSQPVHNRKSKVSNSSAVAPSLVATHHQSQPDGLLAGIRSFITAPLGWMGLSSSGSANGKPSKQQKTSNKRYDTRVSPPSSPPFAPALTYRDLEPRHPRQYSLEPSRAFPPPPPPPPASSAVARSSAAKRYLPTSYSMNYLDAPVEDQPLPPPRSTRAAPSLSSTRHFSPAPAPAPVSGMTRSSTMAFPTAGRDGSLREIATNNESLYGSINSKSRLGGSSRWIERYSQRGEISPAPEDSLPRSNTLLSLPQPTQYRGMSKSSSVFSGLDQSRRSESIEPQPRQRTRTPGGGRPGLGQMVWEPDAGFMSQKTAELRAGPPPPPPSTNAAERILQALESMRSPLTEARRHLPTSATTSQLSDLPRSFSLGRIHIPTASKEHGAKEKETRRADLMISPYGRGKVRRDLEKEKMGRTGGSRLRNMLSMAGKQNGRDDSDSEGEESTEMEDRRDREENRNTKSKGRKANNKRRQQSEDEAESDEVKRYSTRRSTKKQIEQEDSDSMMSNDSEEAPPNKPIKSSASAAAPSKPVDDFRPLPPNTNIDSSSRSRSSLRAKSTSSRKHVSAAGSRGQTPVESSSGRFSAREEDLPDDEDLGKIKFVMPAGGLNIPPVKKEPVSGDSLLSRLEAEKKDLTSKTVNPFAAPAIPSPLGQGTKESEKPKDAEKPKDTEKSKESSFSFGAPLPASSSTSAFAALASNPGSKTASSGVPNFFASTLSKKTDAPLSKAAIESTPKKSFLGLGNGAPSFGSTTPQSTPPPSIPNFFSKPAAESPAPAPAAQAPSNPFAASRPQSLTFTTPDSSASTPAAPTSVAPSASSSGSNPFAGVCSYTSKPAELKITPKEPPKADSAPSANPFAQSKPVATGLSVPSFSFGSAPKASRKVSDGGMDTMDETSEKTSGETTKTSTPAPATAPSTFSFGAPAAKPAGSSSFAFGATPAAAPAPAAASSAPAASTSSTGFSFGSTPATTAPAATTATSSPFSFGASSASTEASKPAAPAPASIPAAPAPAPSTFSFGAPSGGSSAPAAPKPFTFGAPSEAPKPATQAPSAPTSTGFSFGAAPSSAPSSTPFSFGASASIPAEPPKPAANPFGSSSTAAASTNPFGNAAAGPSSGFSFGQTAPTPAAAPAPGSSNVGGAPSVAPSFGGFGSAPAPAPAAPASASSFTFDKPAQPTASPFGAGSASNAPPFGQSASPAFGQAPPSSSSSSPAFGQPAPASTSFTFGSTGSAPPAPASSSPFAFGAPVNGSANAGLPSSGGFSFGSSSNPAGPSANTGFGAPAPSSNPFGSAPPASTFTFGASSSAPTASPFGVAPSGTTTPTGATFAFGAGPIGVATPPRFESPGPQSPAPGGAPALFSMGTGDVAPSPGRVGPGGRPIRPLARRGAKRT